MSSLSRAQRQLADTQPFEVAPRASNSREQVRQSEVGTDQCEATATPSFPECNLTVDPTHPPKRSHGMRAPPPSYSMGSPSNRPLRTTRIAAVAPTQPTIAEGGGGACPTTEEEPESGLEVVGGPAAADDFEAIENNADDFQEPDGDYPEDQAPQEDQDSTRVLQLEAELATTRLELAHATQELNRLHTAMVRRARAEAELLPSTNTGNYWRPSRRS
mmetsp:Transcript_75225/g.213945  ORF Transcript_75225/g.213945 Transcript_75225/m.213945 type:complete len:217 (-) Transcript_75225:101-751(-)